MAMRERVNQTVVHGEAWASAVEKLYQYIWPLVGSAIMTALGAWFASGTKLLEGQGWGAYWLAGIGVACVSMVSLSAVMAAWRYLRPIHQLPTPPLALPQTERQNEQRLADVESELAALPKPDIWDAHVLGAAEAFNQISRELNSIKQTNASQERSLNVLQELAKSLDEKDERLTGKILDQATTSTNLAKESEAKLRAANEKIDTVANSIRHEIGQLTERVYALKTISEMRASKREIERLILLLERPLKQPKGQGNWIDWNKRFQKFQRSIHAYYSYASPYFRDSKNLTFVDPNLYRNNEGDFASENFPDHQTAHDFKTFRKLSDAYDNVGRDMLDHIESRT